MNKWISLLAVLLVASQAVAAPVTTELQERNQMQVGTELDFVLDRNLDASLKGFDFSSQGSAKSQTYLATLGYGITDRVTVVGKLGSSDFTIDDIGFGHSPAGAVELVVRAWRHDPTGIEVLLGGQLKALLNPTARFNEFKVNGSWLEAQANAVAARDFRIKGHLVRPFAGLIYSHLDADMDVQTGDFGAFRLNASNDSKLGFVGGAVAWITGKINTGLQGRVGDDYAVTLSVSGRI